MATSSRSANVARQFEARPRVIRRRLRSAGQQRNRIVEATLDTIEGPERQQCGGHLRVDREGAPQCGRGHIGVAQVSPR